MTRSRKITIIVLIILTLVLAGISVYIAIRLNQQDQAPDDTSAAVDICGSTAFPEGTICGNGTSYLCQNTCQTTSTGNTGYRFICPNTSSSARVQRIAAPTLCPIPNSLSEGDSCDPNDQNGPCDGAGPLTCIRCGANTNAAGQGRCSYSSGDTQGAINACGGLTSTPQPPPETGDDPNFPQCPNNNGYLIFLCPNGCGTDGRCQTGGSEADEGATVVQSPNRSTQIGGNGCGQVDAMIGDPNNLLSGSFCGVVSNTCNEIQCQPGCNDICTGTGQGNCAAGFTCTAVGGANRCRLTANPTSETCQAATTAQCNQACTGTGQGNCAAGLQCLNSVCRNPSLPNDADCTPDSNPQCGDTCTSNSNCPVNNTCTNGVCVLNGCTASTCTNGCTPLAACGSPCGAGNTCSAGNTCDTGRGICVIPQCVGNANCTNNGCNLPSTALFSGEGDNKLLIGSMLIILGLLATQVRFEYLFEKVGRSVDKVTPNFENKVDKDIKNKAVSIKKSKGNGLGKSRKKFEKRF